MLYEAPFFSVACLAYTLNIVSEIVGLTFEVHEGSDRTTTLHSFSSNPFTRLSALIVLFYLNIVREILALRLTVRD